MVRFSESLTNDLKNDIEHILLKERIMSSDDKCIGCTKQNTPIDNQNKKYRITYYCWDCCKPLVELIDATSSENAVYKFIDKQYQDMVMICKVDELKDYLIKYSSKNRPSRR